MRALFPFAVLVAAGLIPACTCSSGLSQAEATVSAEPSSTAQAASRARPVGSLARPGRIPGRVQLNSGALRQVRLQGLGAASASATPAPADSAP